MSDAGGDPLGGANSNGARDECCRAGGGCAPRPPITRRDFLGSLTGGAAGLSAAAIARVAPPLAGAFTGPFQTKPGDFPIPADKQFDPAWLRSLFARGEATAYTKARGELGKIGMPIGGICAGQLYLGGDGRLWRWDVFNLPPSADWHDGNGPHYARPLDPSAPLEQGFALRVDGKTRFLDARGFDDVTFRGQYPIGFVQYRDAQLQVEVDLEAFSPFVPMDDVDSGLPATVLSFTVRNTSKAEVEVEIAGWIENAIGLATGRPGAFVRFNEEGRARPGRFVAARAAATPAAPERATPRPDRLLDDFEGEKYVGWTVTGTAFGDGPLAKREVPNYQGDLDGHGDHVVNSHNVRHGEDVAQGDAHTGRMKSAPFAVDRDYLAFRIGGGNQPGKCCVNLLVGEEVVATATGRNENRMRLECFDLRPFAGATASLEVVDEATGAWGNLGVDEFVLTDVPRTEPSDLARQPDFGTLALATIGTSALSMTNASAPALEDTVHAAIGAGPLPDAAFTDGDRSPCPFPQPLIGSVVRKVTLKPGESATLPFVVAWHFDGLWRESLPFLPEVGARRRFYGTRFRDAVDVVRHVAANFARLAALTRRWHENWYQSSLPWWFLERTLANASILATATCLRFDDGRFWGFEGTYCCPGTCTHVWGYAQSVGRLFPALERDLRERVDFGLSFHADGRIDYRGEAERKVAIDGQCGNLLRTWREHLMSPDGRFLARLWPRVRLAMESVIAHDADQDGILDGAQYNTLDAAWYGAISWTSSLYVAALRACEAMAKEQGDSGFAERCGVLAARGSQNLVVRLFDGEYFVHLPDPAHPESNSTGRGCHIDQLFGQAWALQVGLPRVVPEPQARSALASLYRYSFAPDVGPYREFMKGTIDGGRWYAMAGEAGLLMCTWPKGGAAAATGKGGDAWAAAYFNECMSGFEWQVAGHMIHEGLVQEGLAVARAIHDRYHAARRNPWNEIECSDHYARAMASHGAFLAICGFEHHGPRGHLGFAPRITPEQFRAAFTAADAWGRFEQTRGDDRLEATVAVGYGSLRLATLALELAEGHVPRTARASVNGAAVECRFASNGRRAEVELVAAVVLGPSDRFSVSIT